MPLGEEQDFDRYQFDTLTLLISPPHDSFGASGARPRISANEPDAGVIGRFGPAQVDSAIGTEHSAQLGCVVEEAPANEGCVKGNRIGLRRIPRLDVARGLSPLILVGVPVVAGRLEERRAEERRYGKSRLIEIAERQLILMIPNPNKPAFFNVF